MYSGSDHVSSLMEDPILEPSADTPVMDENDNYSPISEAAEEVVELPNHPSTLNGFVHSVFLPTPLPGRNTPPAARPAQPREALPDDLNAMAILSTLDAMERRLMAEFSTVRNEVADLGRRVDQLATRISHMDNHGRE